MTSPYLKKQHDRSEAEARAEGHTPTPWAVYSGDHHVLMDKDGSSLGDMVPGDPYITPKEAKANAAFVVLAINSYDAMKTALEAALTFANSEAERRAMEDSNYDEPEQANPLIEKMGKALALARGSKP